jgi:transglutaminase-like putative cysteine protease
MLAPVLLSCIAWLPGDVDSAPAYVLESRDVGRVRAVLTYEIRVPNFKAKEWIIYAGQLPELPSQIQVRSNLKPSGETFREQSPLRQQVLRARARGPDLTKGVPIQVTYEALLRSRNLRPLRSGEKPPEVTTLSADERKNALLKLGLIDFGGADVKKWMEEEKLHRQPNEADVDFARRVFLKIRAQFTYEFKEGMDIHPAAVCRARKSDCGGLSTLIVAVLRANGVPARTLAGRWAESAKPVEKVGELPYYQWHVKAEFFAAGVGWVPVDMASAIVWDKSKEGLEHFGHDPGDFLTFNIDDTLELDTIHFGKEKVENLQSPVYWLLGDGKLEPTKKKEDWQVEKRK